MGGTGGLSEHEDGFGAFLRQQTVVLVWIVAMGLANGLVDRVWPHNYPEHAVLVAAEIAALGSGYRFGERRRRRRSALP